MSSKYKYVKEWRKKNPKKRAEQEKRRFKKHKQKIYKQQKDWRDKNSERLRSIVAKRARVWRKNNPKKFQMTQQHYKEKQELKRIEVAGRPRPEVCELCNETAEPIKNGGYRTVFDHNHITGQFRGWICDRCNKVLGLIEDNPDLLKAMIVYLKENK